MKTELVAVNRECDRKNKFFNIVGMTEQEIQTIENRYKQPQGFVGKWVWFTVRR